MNDSISNFVCDSIIDFNPSLNFRMKIYYPQLKNYYKERHQKVFNKLIKSYVNSYLKNYKVGLKSDTSQIKRENIFNCNYKIEYYNGVNISLMLEFSYKYFYDSLDYFERKVVNFNLQKARTINLEEFFPNQVKYLDSLSLFSYKKLKKNKKLDTAWLKSGVMPYLENFENFTFNNKYINIYFNKYQIGPEWLKIDKIEVPINFMKKK